MTKFGEKLTELLKLRKIKQVDVIVGLGLGKNTVNRWCSGETTPPVDLMLRLARFLDVSLEYLVDDAMEKPPMRLQAEDYMVVRFMYASGITPDEALLRLASPVPTPEKRPPSSWWPKGAGGE